MLIFSSRKTPFTQWGWIVLQAKTFQNIHYWYVILRLKIALIWSPLQVRLRPTPVHRNRLLGVCESTVTVKFEMFLWLSFTTTTQSFYSSESKLNIEKPLVIKLELSSKAYIPRHDQVKSCVFSAPDFYPFCLYILKSFLFISAFSSRTSCHFIFLKFVSILPFVF